MYREYLDPDCIVPNTTPLVSSDEMEAPWFHRVLGAVIAHPGEQLHIQVHNADPHECHGIDLPSADKVDYIYRI